MKRSVIAAAVLSSVFMSAGVLAADQETGTLTIHGEVVGNPCYFVDGASNETVHLDQISLTDINARGILSAVDVNSKNTTTLAITCPTIGVNDHVTIRIISPVMTDKGFIPNSYTGAGYPTNSGFMLTRTGEDKVIDNSLNTITIDGSELKNNPKYIIPLTVHYATKAEETNVGLMTATVTLEVRAD